jgi:hypothetical protein
MTNNNPKLIMRKAAPDKGQTPFTKLIGSRNIAFLKHFSFSCLMFHRTTIYVTYVNKVN